MSQCLIRSDCWTFEIVVVTVGFRRRFSSEAGTRPATRVCGSVLEFCGRFRHRGKQAEKFVDAGYLQNLFHDARGTCDA